MTFLRLVFLLLGLGFCAASIAQGVSGYPARPIKLVVPFPPGAGTDTVARLVAQKLTEALGQAVVVENKAGASGAIGAEAVAKAEPDGHTLLFIASPFTTVAAATPTVGYDPLRQFAPVALIATGPLVWVVGNAVPSDNLRELALAAQAKPNAFNYGSAGAGGVNHLALELFNFRTQSKLVHVPYKGIAPATADLIGGQIQALTGTIPALLPHIKQGKLKALAILGPTRNPLLPDVPTAKESGAPGVEAMNYWGIVGPKGLGVEIVARLNAETQKILIQPDFRARMDSEGVEITPGGPERLARLLVDDLSGWKRLITEAKIKLD